MNNEIGRKITSLTLMTIMLAGGMTLAAPSMMPVAHAANANLFVSAENSQFDNYMSGPQVIEVVVIDSDINDTNEGEGEPDVTINGKILRMVQASDGNWYGYFADRDMAQIADSTSGAVGEGLDYGVFCSNAFDLGALDDPAQSVTVGDTVGIAIPDNTDVTGELASGSDTGGVINATCTNVATNETNDNSSSVDYDMNVIREAKSVNNSQPTAGDVDEGGQIGIDPDFWPFIQLYSLTAGGNVIVQYNKGGGVQTTTLTFDTVDQFSGAAIDRVTYPQQAEVHATITDLWLNIDPTDEDSWTFGTFGTPSTNYQVFDENGEAPGDTASNTGVETGSPTDKLSALMCEGNCILVTNPNVQGTGNVFTLQDNDDSALENVDTLDDADTPAGDDGTVAAADEPLDWRTAGDQLEAFIPVTITEQGPNSGVFGTYDEADTSAIVITADALRGTSGSIDYNEDAVSILVGNEFATIDIQSIDDEWSSGEEIPITLVDGDANKNSRADEDLDLFNPSNTIIPALSTGSPFLIESDTDFYFMEHFDVQNDAEGVDGTEDPMNNGATANANEGTSPDAWYGFTDGDASDGASDYTLDRFSARAILNTSDTDTVDQLHSTGQADGTTQTDIPALIVNFDGRDLSDLKAVVRNTLGNAPTAGTFNGFSYFSYDIRTLDNNQDPDGHAVVQTDIYLILGNVDAANTAQADITPILLATDGNSENYCLIDLAANAGLQGRVQITDDVLDAIYNTDTGNAINSCGTFVDDNAAGTTRATDATVAIGLAFTMDDLDTDLAIDLNQIDQPLTLDFTSFGFTDDGVQSSERVADQIVRLELEETGDNTSTFVGTLEYIMVNQLTINVAGTYDGLTVVSDEVSFIVIEDLTDEDSLRVTYDDLGQDGVVTQVSDQEEAPSHSGVVSFDSNSYKIADTVIVTLEDADLNTDSNLIDIYTVVTAAAALAASNADADNNANTYDVVGTAATSSLSWGELGRLLDITFNDLLWSTPDNNLNGNSNDGTTETCGATLTTNGVADTGLGDTGFTLVESAPASGVFEGNFQIPKQHCVIDLASTTDANNFYTWGDANSVPVTTTGVDIEVNYVDFRDASGEIIEVGDSAGVRANTGSISLDRTVYPVPFGNVTQDFTASTGTTPAGDSIFAIHASGFNAGNTITTDGRTLSSGDLTIHIRVNDPDFDTSATGEDTLGVARANIGADATTRGPVKISVIRGADSVVLGYVGGPDVSAGKINIGDPATGTLANDVREFGPMSEIAPDAGIFEADIPVVFTDGPESTLCPSPDVYRLLDNDVSAGDNDNPNRRFTPDNFGAGATNDFCILQGDIIQVEYEDPEDASGNVNTVTDSATFDLRNGVLQSDKSVYIIGSDMILTLIEPDLDLDNDTAETYDLDLIEWDSDAATITMGNADGEDAAFDPEPTDFRETGDSTGIFQIVIEIPEVLANDRLERGEEIVLEYTDWGPSGADFIGQENEDINLTVFTSNFGATVELDQKVYTWTDKVYITIVAPDHNFDSDLVDTIGDTDLDPVKVSTRGFNIDRYSLVETGTDTGIFTGEVILVGFSHNADGNTTTGDGDNGNDKGTQTTSDDGTGPTDGLLQTDDDDGITVSFEFSEDESVVGSALIRWNIGEVQWLEASYPASGTGVTRIIDPDMNLNPEAVDNFNVDVWSDSDAGGIDLTVTETNEATGIFEGTVFFTVADESSGHRLRVAEGDTVTAEYQDNTLPDPYTQADDLDVSATTLIGTIVPPLERAPAANLRTVDAFGNSLDSVAVDQQVQISADLANGQDREQSFAYLVQIQDGNGVTVSLAWITGSLSSGQSFSPALSWIPTEAGTYTATAFVWESVDNPTALSPPVSTTVNVR